MKLCKRANCSNPVTGNFRYCLMCRERILNYLREGKTFAYVSARMEIREGTIWYYQSILQRESSGTMLPEGHQWFDYKDKLDKMLAKITKQTGITDFNTEKGQHVLALINKEFETDRLFMTKDDHSAEIYGSRYGHERSCE